MISSSRPDEIQPAFDAILGVVDDVVAIERADAEAGKDIVLRYASLSASDAAHVAIMTRHQIPRDMTVDRGFDFHPAVERVH